MVQSVNINDDDLELINQLLVSIENIVNEKRLWDIETILEGEGLGGVIQAFLSMLIANFDGSLSRFRIYPRFMKKLNDGKIRVHSSTRISSTENLDITWTLVTPKGEYQKLVIASMNSLTVPIYEETKRKRTEIPRLEENWKSIMRTKERVEWINRIYMKLKEEQGKQKAKEFFDDTESFNEELENLFGFLEGSFQLIAYIAIMGANVNGWKGVIMRKDEDYEVIFDDFRDFEALDNLTSHQKITEKEYLDLLLYQWKQRTKKSGFKIEIVVDKTKRRITYLLKKKPVTKKKGKKLVKGERTVKTKKKKK
ncbi:MAG: hypothetical protein KAS63_05030 [Candidatus Heimdallarchaeota archaeon]|nr:hypothetical protein [Candidatus Heimdallarchaeota archaeon]MCK4954699.1 hypothetical protein [Candidatus Heimdallarchaeota archaeon]